MAKKASRAKAKEPVVLTAAEIQAGLLGRVHQQDRPSTPATIVKGQEKALGQTRAELLEHLETLCKSGAIHRYGTAKSPKLFHEPPQEFLGRAIVGAAAAGPGTWTELKGRRVLKTDAKLVPAKQLEVIRDGLVKAARIYCWPKIEKRGQDRFSTSPPDPTDYLEPLLKEFRKQLSELAGRLNSDSAAVDRLERAAGRVLLRLGEKASGSITIDDPSPDSSDPGRQVLDAMRRADPATSTGAPITFDRIRPLMVGRLSSKAAFDAAVLRLGKEGLVSLHRHDFPSGQSANDREQMVPDGRGGYYFTISRRATT